MLGFAQRVVAWLLILCRKAPPPRTVELSVSFRLSNLKGGGRASSRFQKFEFPTHPSTLRYIHRNTCELTVPNRELQTFRNDDTLSVDKFFVATIKDSRNELGMDSGQRFTIIEITEGN